MGTNYYHHEPDTNHCPHCGRCDKGKRIHIGKSSAGWCFTLHVTDEIQSLEDWKRKWDEGGRIDDEYGREQTPETMLKIITGRHLEGGPAFDSCTWHEREYAMPGPNNLLRFRIRDQCVGHGEGTWDLMEGSFS